MAFSCVNPVTLKEMRQSVRGMFISILLVITLVVNGIFICAELIFNDQVGSDFSISQRLFGQIYFMLVAGSFILIPAYLGNRFAAEISDKDNSLFFSTSLKPSSIIWGKFFSGAMLIVMLYSTVVPFLILLYFLRGLDVVKMLLTIFYSFVFSLLSVMFMLAFNSDATNQGVRRAKNAVGVIFLLFLSGSLGSIYMFVGQSGDSVMSMMYWAKMLTYLVIEILVWRFLFVITVYRISPKLSNRALPVKVYSFVFWLTTGVIAFVWSVPNFLDDSFLDANPLMVWFASMTVIYIVTMIISAAEPDSLSRRARTRISNNAFVRFFQYFFYTGCVNTFVYSLVMAVVTVFICAGCQGAGFGRLDSMTTITLTAAVLYGTTYGLTTITVKRKFFKNKSDTKIPILITLGLVLAGTVTPILIAFYSYDDLAPMNELGWYAVGNPFILFSEKWPILEVLVFTGVATIVLAAFNWRMFFDSIRKFERTK